MEKFFSILSNFKLEKEEPYIYFKLCALALLIPAVIYGNLSVAMWACVFFYACYMTLARCYFGELDEQPDAIFGFACWIQLVCIEICSLLQVNFWLDLPISVLVVFAYYVVKAMLKQVKFASIDWLKNAVVLLSISYLVSILLVIIV